MVAGEATVHRCEVRHAEFVVVRDWVAQIRAALAGLRQRGFQIKNGLSLGLGLGFLFAHEGQHLCDVRDVGFALLRKTVLQVVVAVGQTESALAEMEGIDRAVFGIRAGGITEHGADAALLEFRKQAQ